MAGDASKYLPFFALDAHMDPLQYLAPRSSGGDKFLKAISGMPRGYREELESLYRQAELDLAMGAALMPEVPPMIERPTELLPASMGARVGYSDELPIPGTALLPRGMGGPAEMPPPELTMAPGVEETLIQPMFRPAIDPAFAEGGFSPEPGPSGPDPLGLTAAERVLIEAERKRREPTLPMTLLELLGE